MKRKIFTAPLELKQDGEPGEFRAVFATLNVMDLDEDVTPPGAFSEQPVIVEPWNHQWTLPAGKGVVKADDKEAWIEGRFFLDTDVGQENYQTVKNLGDLAEWSYTFDILEADSGVFEGNQVRFLRRMDVVGVSPVSRGAGIDTRTVAIKGHKRAISSHSTATTEVGWDGPANEARLRNDENATYYRRAYAWQDPDGDPDVKSSYKFIHHVVAGDGNVGAANVRACQTGIGVLNGGRGGTTIQKTDRQGVYNHLARHLRDADVEPPELKSVSEDEADAHGQVSDGKSSDLNTLINLAEIGLIVRRMEIES